MVGTSTPHFSCPNCGTPYKLVRVEAESDPAPDPEESEIACPVCGAPLRGREGPFILKYFLLRRVGRPESGQYSIW